MKKKIALAIVFAAVISLAGCELPFEIRMKENNTSVENTEDTSHNNEDEEQSEALGQSDETNLSEPETLASDPISVSNADITYEPVVNKIGEIESSGDLQYFICTSEYGNAFTTRYRYIYQNGNLDSAVFEIIPGEVTDLETIIENMGGGVEASDFTENTEGWSLTKDVSELNPMFQDSDIEDLYVLMQMSLLTEQPETSTNSDESDLPESDPISTPGTDAAYEPVVNTIGDIGTSGELQYFNCTSEYGNAFTTIYRYVYQNGTLDYAVFEIIPGEVTDLDTIVEQLGDGVEASAFTENINGWTLTRDASELNPTFQDSDIEDLYALMQMSLLTDSE